MAYIGEQKRKYDREWVAKRRAAWFADKYCAKCKSIENLRLDHIDPTLKVSHSIWSWAIARREVELAKCQVLCEPCHKKKTKANNEHARGEQSGQARLTELQVKEIRRLYAARDGNQYELADRFGVGQRTICDLLRRKTWGWLP